MSANPQASTSQPDAGPLSDVRILDFTHFLAGPYATSIMAHLGADIIKVEDPKFPDETRLIGPFTDQGLSLYFASLNSGKRGLGLSLRNPGAASVLARLAANADVVVHNYRPGTADKLGLSHQFFASVNPKIVTCALSGFGETGPYALLPGYDYTIQAMSGVMSLTGEPDGLPGKAGISYVDHSGGLTAAFAIASALYNRERTGKGRHLDVSLLDMQMSMLTYIAAWQMNAGVTVQRTPRASHPTLIPAQNFQTSDGYLSIFVGNDEMWLRFVDATEDVWLASEFLRTNPQRQEWRAALLAHLDRMFLTKTTQQWVEVLRTAKVACGPIMTVQDALDDPHNLERRLVREASNGDYRYVSSPLPMLEPQTMVRAAPLVGDSSRDVLRQAGYSATEVDNLIQQGVVSVDGGSRS